MDPGIKVPPEGYGGHERLVYLMAKEYKKSGHDVHLLVTKGSIVPGCTIHGYGSEGMIQNNWKRIISIITVWLFLLKNHKKFDLIHNFGRLAFLFPVLNKSVKKIMTYGRVINERNIRTINKFPNKNLIFTGASNDLISRITQIGSWYAVHNTIDFNDYTLIENVPDDAPFIFLGRLEKFKGCHTAIKVAKAVGRKLIIAGNISTLKEEIEYFNQELKPHIDGDFIKYVGVVNDKQKNEWLGKCAALLFPIEGIEAFGIVMIEAMACGTPVIGMKEGAVDEVIENGINGFKVNSVEEMIASAMKTNQINRKECRYRAEDRFNVNSIANKYLSLFTLNRNKKIVLVTTGQPSANPRMMKEYRSLKKEGYQVKVLYTYTSPWAHHIDENNFNSGKIDRNDFLLIGGSPNKNKFSYLKSRLYFKIFRTLSNFSNLIFIKEMSMSRTAFQLYIKSRTINADLVIAHYLGAVPAALRVAKINHIKAIFDAEDFHRGEKEYYPGMMKKIIDVENKLFPMFDFVSTASEMITDKYQELFPKSKFITINNVFSIANLQKPQLINKDQSIKLFWFSQFVGPNRGLEIIFDALKILNNQNVHFYILGDRKYDMFLKTEINKLNFKDNIHLVDPMPEENIFEFASKMDIGLAAEIPYCLHKDICMANKIFTYLLSGICILASDTSAQTQFIEQNKGIGLNYINNDPKDLAEKINSLLNNTNLMNEFKMNAYELAKNKMNWETESKKIINLVNSCLSLEN